MMTAGLTSPVKSHLCDLQMPRPRGLGPEMRGSLQQQREPDTHHDVQQEKSLRTLLRDTKQSVYGTPRRAQPMHTCSLVHFAASLHCFLWNLQQIPGLPFALSCHKLFLCFCWKSTKRCAPLESCAELLPPLDIYVSGHPMEDGRGGRGSKRV